MKNFPISEKKVPLASKHAHERLLSRYHHVPDRALEAELLAKARLNDCVKARKYIPSRLRYLFAIDCNKQVYKFVTDKNIQAIITFLPAGYKI
jgi:hypothetical protein